MARVTVPAASGEKDADKDHHLERASHLRDDPEPGILHRTLDQVPAVNGGERAGDQATRISKERLRIVTTAGRARRNYVDEIVGEW
jgi:hypothetical protein